MSDVSVLGLGLMGSSIAHTLIDKGYSVTVWNRTPEKAVSLTAAGGKAAFTAVEAVESSPITLSVVVDSSALVECLGDDIDLTGRTIVNLATGTPADAHELEQWVTKRNGLMLSGTISAYPKDIGTPIGGVNYAGPIELWNRHAEMLLALGGFSGHVGEVITDACTLDLSMLIYYMSSIAAFQEAVVFAEAFGVSPDRLLELVRPTLPVLEREFDETVRRVESGDYTTDEATIGTFHHCMDLVWKASATVAARPIISSAARELFALGVSGRRANEIPSGVVPLLRQIRDSSRHS
jgi:3-hydroxyisobutyrate dehydrogenase-like beta-hydroxyacid dehydrogenase